MVITSFKQDEPKRLMRLVQSIRHRDGLGRRIRTPVTSPGAILARMILKSMARPTSDFRLSNRAQQRSAENHTGAVILAHGGSSGAELASRIPHL